MHNLISTESLFLLLDAVNIVLLTVMLIGGTRDWLKSSRWFRLFLWLTAACLLHNCLDFVLCLGVALGAARSILPLIVIASIAVGYFSCVLLMHFLYDISYSESPTDRYTVIIMDCLSAFSLLLILVLYFNGQLMSFADGVMLPGSMYYIINVYPLLLLISCIVLTVAGKLQFRQKCSFIYFCLLPIAGLAISVVLQMPALTAYTNALMILSIYLYLNGAKRNQMIRQKEELADLRYQTMISQIQPHFLYNMLSVIQDMCHDRAPEAEQLVNRFSQYLRQNLASIRATTPIPFDHELEHVKLYVQLEQARFGDRVNVEYQIEQTNFRIPSLVLQTIVENAIRHGITKRPEGGTVRLQTGEIPSAYLIIVTDNGVGFQAQKKDTDTHIGIESARYRLKEMCGGSLHIESSEQQGTTVVITIPKQENTETQT